MDKGFLYGYEEPEVVHVIDVSPGLFRVLAHVLIRFAYIITGAGLLMLVQEGLGGAWPILTIAFACAAVAQVLGTLTERHWAAVDAAEAAGEVGE